MASRTPTYREHVLLQAAGQLGPVGSAWEIFSYSIRVAGSTAVRNPSDPTTLNDMLDDLVAFHQRPESKISSGARLTSLKAAYVLPDGKWRDGVPMVSRTVNVAGGGYNNANVNLLIAPPQVSLAITLRTDLNTPRARGRFFLPLPSLQATYPDGLIPAADATTIGGSVKTLINALNNQPGVDENDARVAVASTFGGIHNVTSVSVGRVLDTIRSRRNAIREAYVSTAL